MKLSLFFLCLLVAASTSTLASADVTNTQSTFDINSKIIIDGKLISSPHIIVHANQLASLHSVSKNNIQDMNVKVFADNAKVSGNDAIRVKFDVLYKDGKETMHANPEFIMTSNQEGKIKIATDDAKHTFEMRVIAKRTIA